MTAVHRPGADRGLGRYALQIEHTLRGRGMAVDRLVLPSRAARGERVAEYVDLLSRSVRLRRCSFDVFHATNPYAAALAVRGRRVVSILDLIPLDMPEHRRTGLKARTFLGLAARADAILTISRFSAARIVARLGVPPGKVIVAPIPPGPLFRPTADDDAERLSRLGVRAPFLSTLIDLRTPDPRKRAGWIPVLGRAVAKRGFEIVAVGAGTESIGRGGGVRGVGRLPDEDLAALLRGSYAFVYTSAYEGQGLPPLEALACGSPVVAPRNTAIPEVVGDAGLLVADDEDAWARPSRADSPALARLLATVEELIREPALRRDLAARAAAQAGRFSEAAFGEAIESAYRA
jgi:glycosyltransferase involved in cell wall biosynthesis